MIRAGVAVTVFGAAVGIVWVLLDAATAGPAVILAPQMIIGFASGFMLPNAIAGAVSVRPQAAGAASGITGFMQMGARRRDRAAHRPPARRGARDARCRCALGDASLVRGAACAACVAAFFSVI